MGILDRFSLEGRTALVTGAGQGIGRALALALAEAGADVAVADIAVPAVEETAQEIISRGQRALALQADISDGEAVRDMVACVLAEWGQLTIAVNNVGIRRWAPAEAFPLADWDAVMNTNLRGTFLCCQAEGREMLARGYGKIINIASMSATIVNHPQTQVAYNASKAAIVHMTRSLAAEWAPRGVRVNCISPGYTRTPLVQRIANPAWLADIPMGRLAETSDLQGAAVYLAAECSDYITGHNLIVDGGFTLW
ncbi:MAG: glucose 1-dehydrogenase [Chloroflexi bacterium]|nr:glucose 1-dehydrogenase [Chloroflexota bacterium]